MPLDPDERDQINDMYERVVRLDTLTQSYVAPSLSRIVDQLDKCEDDRKAIWADVNKGKGAVRAIEITGGLLIGALTVAVALIALL